MRTGVNGAKLGDNHVRPALVIMTGVCAGRERYSARRCHRGEHLLGLRQRKISEVDGGFLFSPDPLQIALYPMLRNHAEALSTNQRFLRNNKVRNVNSVLNLVVAPAATGQRSELMTDLRTKGCPDTRAERPDAGLRR